MMSGDFVTVYKGGRPEGMAALLERLKEKPGGLALWRVVFLDEQNPYEPLPLDPPPEVERWIQE